MSKHLIVLDDKQYGELLDELNSLESYRHNDQGPLCGKYDVMILEYIKKNHIEILDDDKVCIDKFAGPLSDPNRIKVEIWVSI